MACEKSQKRVERPRIKDICVDEIVFKDKNFENLCWATRYKGGFIIDCKIYDECQKRYQQQ